jgi:hypothetical protein
MFSELIKIQQNNYNYPTRYLLAIYKRNKRRKKYFSYYEIENDDKNYVFLIKSLLVLKKILSQRENVITSKIKNKEIRISKLKRNRNKGK